MENSDNTSRSYFDANVSLHDLVEFYWPAFRSCVQRAHAGSIMCSYNAVNGAWLRTCEESCGDMTLTLH